MSKNSVFNSISKEFCKFAVGSAVIICIQHPSFAMDESGKLLGGAASTLMQVSALQN